MLVYVEHVMSLKSLVEIFLLNIIENFINLRTLCV